MWLKLKLKSRPANIYKLEIWPASLIANRTDSCLRKNFTLKNKRIVIVQNSLCLKANFILLFNKFTFKKIYLVKLFKEACKGKALFKIVWVFIFFAVHKYFCKIITPYKSDALQKCSHTNVTSCNKWRRAKVTIRENCPLVQNCSTVTVATTS